MELRKAAGYAIIGFMILLCTLATDGSQGKRRAEMDFGHSVRIEVNEEMAKQAWIHSRKELIDRKYLMEDFDFCMPQEATNYLKSAFLTRRDIYNAITFLPPQMRRELLDCIRKKNLLFGISSQKPRSTNWFIKRFQLLLGWPNAPRRYLASGSHQRIDSRHSPSPASAPAVASPIYDAPTPSPTSASSPSPSPASAPAVASPVNDAATPNPAPASSPSPDLRTLPFFEKKPHQKRHTSNSPPPSPSAANHKRSPHTSHIHKRSPSQEDDDVKKQIFVAIIATATATFCFVAMLFLCWCCFKGTNNKIGPRDGTRDEKPLLHLNLSANSSHNSLSIGDSSNKEHSPKSGKTTLFKSSLSIKYRNHDSPLDEAPLTDANAEEALPSVKPPPGVQAPPPPPPGPRPPPPPKYSRAPPAPPPKGKLKSSPLGPHHQGHNNSSNGDDLDSESGAQKAKLKPFFWDKVMASPNHSMVWNEIRAGSFQFNEEMIESLFGYNAVDNNKNDRKRDSSESSIQYIRIIDPRKAQNLSILLRALNVTTEEVLEALREAVKILGLFKPQDIDGLSIEPGNELPVELLQTLLKMAPTSEEELKLRLFTGDISQLGPAERFLKVMVEIPCAFKRIESLLFMSSLQEEVSTLKESFATLEVACNKVRNSRLFLKLLEAVLKTGNRMNDGTYRGGAQAFRLDTLLKLSDVKGIDGRTTLLHFVVQEIIRSEGIRSVRTARASRSVSSVKSDDFIDNSNPASEEHYRNLGLQVVSGLSSELEDVKKAAVIDADVITSTVSKLNQLVTKTKLFLDSEMRSLEEDSEFYNALANFVDRADSDISWLSEEETRIMALVKSTADYFHGNAGRDEGLRLFTIIRDFLIMLDKACKEVRDDRATKSTKTSKKEAPALSVPAENHQQSDIRTQRLFPAIAQRRADYSSSDDER